MRIVTPPIKSNLYWVLGKNTLVLSRPVAKGGTKGGRAPLRPVQNALWLIIIMIENDNKNGIAINHIIRQLL